MTVAGARATILADRHFEYKCYTEKDSVTVLEGQADGSYLLVEQEFVIQEGSRCVGA